MKKTLTLTFLLILLCTTFTLAATENSRPATGWVPLYHLSNSNLPKVTTGAEQKAHMRVQVTVPGFDLSTIQHNYQPFHRITLPEQSNNFNLGTPNVPFLREIISVPEGSVLKINVTDVKYKTYGDINLEPAQRALDEIETEADREFRRDEAIYGTNEFYPANWVSSYKLGKHREVDLTTLEMHPVRYNPVTREIQVAYSITFTVEFEGYTRYSISDIPEHLEETYKGLLLNYDYMNYELRSEKVRSSSAQAATDYLIIAASNLVNSPSLKKLVAYHQGQGRVVEVRDVKTMGADADQIKTAIKQIYAQATPAELDYILLVGDTDTVPLQKWAYYDYRSDVWYGYLEGGDKIADVGVGRFPARNENELANMVKKTLDFHTNANPGPWQQRGLFVAHAEQYPRKYTECKESIVSHNFKLPTPEFIKIYGGDKTKNWTNADLIREINKGALVINYRGHGQKDHWHPWNKSRERFSVEDVYNLKNGTKTPVIFNIACYNGDIEHSPESLLEAQIRHPNGGAVAALGALNLSGTQPNHDFDRALFFGTWDLGIKSIGDLLNYSIAEMLKKHGMNKNVVIYLWLGDPALSIRGINTDPSKMRLSTMVEGSGNITLNPAAGSYDKGTVVTVTAKADAGWKFTGWSGDLTGQTASAKVTMNSHKSITATFVLEKLFAPANLTAKALSTDKISLSWDFVAGADSYTIYRADSAAGTYTEVATVTNTTATIDKLQPKTTYYFKVKAKKITLISDFSAHAAATTKEVGFCTLPGWDPTKVYTNETVCHNNVHYKAQWWHKGSEPGKSQWGPWKKVGSCGGTNPVNLAPEVSITSPAANASFKAPANVQILIVAKDNDGKVAKVELFQGAKLLGIATAGTNGKYTFGQANLAKGTYTYKVVATDDKGAKGEASITFNVTDGSINPGNSWAPNISYKVGDLVSYNSISYKCTSDHRSLRGWEPPNVPALWRKQ